MKGWIYIAFFLLGACTIERDRTQENIAIYGAWVAGESPKIQALIFDNEKYTPADDQEFELVFPDGEMGRFIRTTDYYELQTERLPVAGEHVVLNWLNGNDTARVFVEFPAQVEVLVIQNDTLSVAGNTGSLIEWSVPTEGVEYALQLECTEEQPIPLPSGPGNFADLHNGPQVSSQIELDVAAFSFYGSHRLTISVLNEDLFGLFFFDPFDIRGLLKNGPDNVIGGKGFISATTMVEIPLEIE